MLTRRKAQIGSRSFCITGPASYVGFDGKQGRFAYDQTSGIVAFQGGALDTLRAKYESPNGGMIRFLSSSGDYANTDCTPR